MSINPYQSPGAEPSHPPTETRIPALVHVDSTGKISVWYRVIGGYLIAYGLYSTSCTGLMYFSGFHELEVVSVSIQVVVYALLPVSLILSGILLCFTRRFLLAIAQVLLFVCSLLIALKTVLWMFMLFQESEGAPVDVWWITFILMLVFELMPSWLAMVGAFVTAARLNAIIRPETVPE